MDKNQEYPANSHSYDELIEGSIDSLNAQESFKDSRLKNKEKFFPVKSPLRAMPFMAALFILVINILLFSFFYVSNSTGLSIEQADVELQRKLSENLDPEDSAADEVLIYFPSGKDDKELSLPQLYSEAATLHKSLVDAQVDPAQSFPLNQYREFQDGIYWSEE